jgi:hypothetical protein
MILVASVVAALGVTAGEEPDDAGVISPLLADRPVPGVTGPYDVVVAGASGTPTGVVLGGETYQFGSDFPSFVVLDDGGRRSTVSGADPGVQRTVRRDGRRVVASYSFKGLVVDLHFVAAPPRVSVVADVRREGPTRIVSIGGTVLSRTPSQGTGHERLVDGSGWLVSAGVPRPTAKRWDGNDDNLIGGVTTAAFVALLQPDRLVMVKPLTFAHTLGWSVTPGATGTTVAVEIALHFRPAGAHVPTTALAHSRLGFRLETAGDRNGDGLVDWVDAGIAYRERYVKEYAGPVARSRLRDGFRVYYEVYTFPSYRQAFEKLGALEFAEGIWWMKGMMEPASWDDWESHKFQVRPNGRLGELGPTKVTMARRGQTLGLYYGHDYIVLDGGSWPDEFVKKDPDGRPYRYTPGRGPYLTKYYKDNVRSLASGALFRHYDAIVATCHLEPGDSIMLDTFSAFARPGYDPAGTATAEVETQAKRRIAEYLARGKGLIVAGEGLVEGLQDTVVYGANAVVPTDVVRERWWIERDGVRRLPMLPVVFQGAGYYGAGWYELRHPDPNWAIGLVYGVGYWDWLSQGPEHAWRKIARYYFNQNLVWSEIADLKVRRVRQHGDVFEIDYDGGARLWADVGRNRWTWTRSGATYDGFTPFNARGYMAVLRTGDFSLRIPGRHRLEIAASQPNRAQIRFAWRHDGEDTVVEGRLDPDSWSLPTLMSEGERERTVRRPVAPVLVLRRL